MSARPLWRVVVVEQRLMVGHPLSLPMEDATLRLERCLWRPLTTSAILRALAPVCPLDEVEDVAGVVVGLPVAVCENQHLHPAETASQVPPALGRRLRPQPTGLEHGGEFLSI